MNSAIVSAILSEMSSLKRNAAFEMNGIMEKIAAIPMELSEEQANEILHPIFLHIASLLKYIG